MLVLPLQGVLRNPQKLTIIPSLSIDGILFLIAIAFLIARIAYGIAACCLIQFPF